MDWETSYYKKWSAGDKFQIYDKNPRNGGKQIGIGKIRTTRSEEADLILRDKKYGEKEAHMEGFGHKENPLMALVHTLQERGIDMDSKIYRVHFNVLEIDNG
jgi:hypothetical protein